MVPRSPSVERVVSPTRNSGNQWHFSVLRTEGAVQCIISRSTSREWDPGDARLRKEDRREADDLEIRLRASLPSSLAPPFELSTPAGGSKTPRAKGSSQLVFTSRLCQTFAIPTIVFNLPFPRPSAIPVLFYILWSCRDGSQIFNLWKQGRLNLTELPVFFLLRYQV